jgi:dUTP pyrophosphatase
LYTPCSQSFTQATVNVIDFKVICAAVFYSKSPNGMIAKNSGFYMYPRSSLARTDLRLANNVGIIDSGYRGSLKGIFDYVGDRMHVHRQVGQYERIVQLCSPTLGPVYIELVDSLNRIGTTERGDGGFGSTGVL